jgi:hypothetical protein
MIRFTLTSALGRTRTATVPELLDAAGREQARVEANRWIKSLRLASYEGVPMRQRFHYRGDSLWWFTELYLHKMRRLDTALSVLLALDAARDAHAPARVIVDTDDYAAGAAAAAFGAARRVPVDVRGSGRPASRTWQSLEIAFASAASRLRRARANPPSSPAVAAFVHTAFWREAPTGDGPQQESYIGTVLDALTRAAGPEALYCVGVGPRRNFRARRWWDPVAGPAGHRPLITPIEVLAPWRALEGSRALWNDRHQLARDLTTGGGIRAAAEVRGCDLWPVLSRELHDAATVQWPWSARAMDEAGAALDALAPGVALTYAEAGGWGRAIMLEARRRGIPSAGLQHGFIYRHWLNYLHEPDEMLPQGDDRGFPRPDVTLLFDKYAEQHLRDAGHFPAQALEVTGNARLDELAVACATLRPRADGIRRALEVPPGRPCVVLAAKYSEIREVLPALVHAIERLPDVMLLIKPHPAETPDVYASHARPNIRVVPGSTGLAEMLAIADVLVTMNSTVAIDALILDVPSLVIGLPNNLSPLVEAGAMRGADGAGAIEQELRALLYDAAVRRAVLAAGAGFAARYALASDGQAGRRSAETILARARTARAAS